MTNISAKYKKIELSRSVTVQWIGLKAQLYKTPLPIRCIFIVTNFKRIKCEKAEVLVRMNMDASNSSWLNLNDTLDDQKG